MAGKKRSKQPGTHAGDVVDPPAKNCTDTGRSTVSRDETGPGTIAMFRSLAPALIVFLFSFFFVITISNPAIYMNDEWITANQLHQLDIGHQVTFSEAKYGVTWNGTVSAYFTSRQNVLMYSLAFPVSALPMVKLFGLFGDNFRLIVILAWSLCPVLIALIIDAYYPEYARVRGIRVVFPILAGALFLFMGNILLYKQFPFSAPDAPFEVAALVLTNQIFFALIATVIFSIIRLLVKNTWMALFGTCASVSSSSYIFWSAAAKDHILTTLVFLLVLYTFILYLFGRQSRYAALAFVFSGLLIWIRPEMGFFVTLFLGLSFIIPHISAARRMGIPARELIVSILPAAGICIGVVPFILNNILISHNWLIPVFDLPRNIQGPGATLAEPLPVSQVINDPSIISQAGSLSPADTLVRVGGMIARAIFGGLSYDNLVRGLAGTLTFPQNNSIGFLIMCPLAVIGLCALLLWWDNVLAAMKAKKEVIGFIILMTFAVFFSYATKFSSMNTSLGVLPDMRYLSPAYAPCGILAVFILTKTPCLKNDAVTSRALLRYSFWGSIILIPIIFFVMIFIQPFTKDYAGFSLFFKLAVLVTLAFCAGAMILSRIYPDGSFIRMVPLFLVLVIIVAFSFQIMLTSLYGLLMKTNGYPFWIPLIREGVGLFLEVQYMAPV
ncbi:hypothetical protein [Methanoregula sp. PtaB.Bin085]|uniref:hypothetical protein n=2 Tax=unclassified Methanoregula TaxID=2649730 RepID=UPI0009C7F741|nr:hypothetical protein [Methanoregula sp. PtaB.Bin085]OPX64504.1 MAG: hypothetical protein A4E33_00854 [Methanoregula sp. PtaB.Bin085]